jgi:hypothetical protein
MVLLFSVCFIKKKDSLYLFLVTILGSNNTTLLLFYTLTQIATTDPFILSNGKRVFYYSSFFVF